MTNNWSYVYNLALLAGTAYLVSTGWSGWWFVLTACLILHPGPKDDEVEE